MLVKIIDNFIISGLLMGGIYALIAVGLNLQYGVARVFNVSHGEFIMIGAFITYVLHTALKINPLITLVIAGPIVFLIGYFLHRTVFKSLLKSSVSIEHFSGRSIMICFGLMYVICNIGILIFSGDHKGYTFLKVPIKIGGAVFAANKMVALLFAVIIAVIFYLFLKKTRLGKAIRAAAQDPNTAGLMGVNINQVLALCFGLGALMASFAGSLYSMSYTIKATMGLENTVTALVVVVLGGMGSITGSFIGGILLGIIGASVNYFVPSLYMVSYYFIFILLLLIKPTGIMGKK